MSNFVCIQDTYVCLRVCICVYVLCMHVCSNQSTVHTGRLVPLYIYIFFRIHPFSKGLTKLH